MENMVFDALDRHRVGKQPGAAAVAPETDAPPAAGQEQDDGKAPIAVEVETDIIALAAQAPGGLQRFGRPGQKTAAEEAPVIEIEDPIHIGVVAGDGGDGAPGQDMKRRHLRRLFQGAQGGRRHQEVADGGDLNH